MRKTFQVKYTFLPVLLLAACLASGCEPAAVPPNSNARATNSNANLSNANTGVMNTNANSPVSSTTSTVIDTREPEQYQATVTLKFETMGQQNLGLPPLTAQVARNGGARRMEFALPNGEKVIYLDSGEKHLLISPERKQYAELNQESLGFEIRRMMTPGRIVQQMQTLKGTERVGEEQFNGRTAIKYRLNTTTDTKSQAGNVATEAVILVDKETGLPLRSETVSESQTGEVKGLKGFRLVTELSNIKTTTDAALFAEPTDFKKVEPEQVRSQVNTLFNAAAAIIGQVLKSSSQATTATPQK